MEWKELTDEEVGKLEFSGGRGGNSQYKPLLDAVEAGKTIRVDVPDGTTPKAISQRLYTAAKGANRKISVRITADKKAVVITKANGEEAAPPPPQEQPGLPLEGKKK